MQSLKDWWSRFQTSRWWRAWQRYGNAKGNLLAAGIAYVAFFSVFPMLALAFTGMAYFLGGRTDLQDKIIASINDQLGMSLVGRGNTDAFINLDALINAHVVTVTGVVGLVTAVLTGLGWVDSMHQGISAVFGLQVKGNVVVRKLQDVAVLAVVGVLFLATVLFSLVLSAVADDLLTALGITGSFTRVATRIAVGVGLLALDVVIYLMFFKVMARIPVPWRTLLPAALLGSIGLEILKLSGPLVVKEAAGNKFLASAALVLVLLLWFNFFGRITLLAAALGAETAAERGELPPEDTLDAPPPRRDQSVAQSAESNKTADAADPHQ